MAPPPNRFSEPAPQQLARLGAAAIAAQRSAEIDQRVGALETRRQPLQHRQRFAVQLDRALAALGPRRGPQRPGDRRRRAAAARRRQSVRGEARRLLALTRQPGGERRVGLPGHRARTVHPGRRQHLAGAQQLLQRLLGPAFGDQQPPRRDEDHRVLGRGPQRLVVLDESERRARLAPARPVRPGP